MRVAERARALGLRIDLLELWLPRGWKESWVPRRELRELADAGVAPVVVHYFFGDGISRERVERDRAAWRASLERLGSVVAIERRVLVVLEPEFNDAPPSGETAITTWPGFGAELAEAAAIVRRAAPQVWIGTCPGDFSPDRDLERSLAAAIPSLDFLAFQEMRAGTDSRSAARGYLEVGRAAVEYARYLRRFDRPLLLAYLAVSSHDGWEENQVRALHDLARHRETLARQGVFGAIWFQLRDDPEHRGYFGNAEKHFGLLDADGHPKPALAAFRALTRAQR
jgi:hypothetical protein